MHQFTNNFFDCLNFEAIEILIVNPYQYSSISSKKI